MKDENGNKIQMATVEIYRLENVAQGDRYSRKHNVWLHWREYRLHGAISPDEAERALAAMFQKIGGRRITAFDWSPDFRRVVVRWQE